MAEALGVDDGAPLQLPEIALRDIQSDASDALRPAASYLLERMGTAGGLFKVDFTGHPRGVTMVKAHGPFRQPPEDDPGANTLLAGHTLMEFTTDSQFSDEARLEIATHVAGLLAVIADKGE